MHLQRGFFIAAGLFLLRAGTPAFAAEACPEDLKRFDGIEQAAVLASSVANAAKDSVGCESPKLTRIAETSRKRVESIISVIRKHSEFAKSFLQFNQALENYEYATKKKWFCGLDCREKAVKQVEIEKDAIFSAITKTSIEHSVQKELKRGVFDALRGLYEDHSARALRSARRASIGLAAAGTVLSADLIFFSALTGGSASGVAAASTTSTASVIAGVFTASATTAISGAAGGAGFVGGIGLAKIIGHAAAVEQPGMDFYCRLAKEVEANGKRVMDEAVAGSKAGALLGGGLGAAGAVAPLVARAGATALGAGFTGMGTLATAGEISVAREHLKKAKDAADRGDEIAALDHVNAFRKAAIDAGLDFTSTALAAFVTKKAAQGLVKSGDGKRPSLKDAINRVWNELRGSGRVTQYSRRLVRLDTEFEALMKRPRPASRRQITSATGNLTLAAARKLQEEGFAVSRILINKNKPGQRWILKITNVPKNTQIGTVMARAHQKYGVGFVFDPYEATANGFYAGFSRQHRAIYFSTAYIAESSATVSRALRHEIHHTDLLASLKNGVRKPYSATIQNGKSYGYPSGYDDYFQFDELATYRRDMFETGAGRWAESLKAYSLASVKATTEALEVAQRHPGSVRYGMDPELGQVFADIAIGKAGQAKMRVWLVDAANAKDSPNNQAILHKYLNEIRRTAKLHETEAERMLKGKGN
ncbi:MAG TPA: hypothetical protein VJB59_02875 [Bdellovibrionota bacterium]|nr:hypothetical protein [Bdellovibrionota bacterium]